MPLFTNEDLDTVVNGAGASAVNIQDGGNSITVDGTVTSNIGTTGGLALDATLAKLTIAQSTALGTNTGALVMGSVTTAAPTYTTGNINPLSLTTTGLLRVDGSAVTQPISAVSLPLPTGAATEATLATRLADATFTARINTLGQKTSANSTPIVIASDQSAIPVTFTATNTTTSTVTSVSVSTTVATLSASNAAKTSVIVFNEAGTLFVKLGAGATSASYSYRLTANTALEINGYAGIVTGIKSSGTSAALVTEVGI